MNTIMQFDTSTYFHVKSIYDEMPFGAHKGTQIGIIYLFDPNYIEWALRVTDGFCIKDIQSLQNLKTYASEEASRSVLLSEIGREVAYERVERLSISFDTLVYGGVYNFSFSEKAIKNNQNKLKQANANLLASKLPEYNPNETIFFLNLIEVDIWGTQTIKVGCKRIEEESNYVNIVFDYDNSNNRNLFLPKIEHCNLGFVFPNSSSNNSNSNKGIVFQSGISIHTISFKNGNILEIK